jgi:type IV secretion system protein TrbB
MTDKMEDAWEQKRRLLELLLGQVVLDLINNPDRHVTDVWVNPDGEWWKEEDRIRSAIGTRSKPEHVRQIIGLAADLGGRVGNKYSPIVETRLPWGQRFEGMLPPVVNGGPTLVIRVHRRVAFKLESYLSNRQIDPIGMELLDWAMRSRLNVAICGITGSGKTAFADALYGHAAVAGERVLSIEETPELKLDAVADKVRLVVDPRTPADQVVKEMRKLVRAALRMRPDRIIIGEVRGGEILEWIKALYSGHAGGLLTLHADDPRDCMDRLEMMLAESVRDTRAYRSRLCRVIERIVWMRRDTEVGWKVAGIYRPVGYDTARGKFELEMMAGLPLEL